MYRNGTVPDNLTGLMWAQCVVGLSGAGCTTGAAYSNQLGVLLDRADTSTLAGYADWRLPNIKEWSSIVEHRCAAPAINLAVFPNPLLNNYWSASPSAGTSNAAWYLDNAGGYGINGRTGSGVARLVRTPP